MKKMLSVDTAQATFSANSNNSVFTFFFSHRDDTDFCDDVIAHVHIATTMKIRLIVQPYSGYNLIQQGMPRIQPNPRGNAQHTA